MAFVTSDLIKSLVEQTHQLHQIALLLAQKDKQDATNVLILKEVKDYYNFDITRRTRIRKFVEARHMACYILRKYTNMSLNEIAAVLKLRDHTTVIHGLNRLQGLLDTHDQKSVMDERNISNLVEAKFNVLPDQRVKDFKQENNLIAA